MAYAPLMRTNKLGSSALAALGWALLTSLGWATAWIATWQVISLISWWGMLAPLLGALLGGGLVAVALLPFLPREGKPVRRLAAVAGSYSIGFFFGWVGVLIGSIPAGLAAVVGDGPPPIYLEGDPVIRIAPLVATLGGLVIGLTSTMLLRVRHPRSGWTNLSICGLALLGHSLSWYASWKLAISLSAPLFTGYYTPRDVAMDYVNRAAAAGSIAILVALLVPMDVALYLRNEAPPLPPRSDPRDERASEGQMIDSVSSD